MNWEETMKEHRRLCDELAKCDEETRAYENIVFEMFTNCGVPSKIHDRKLWKANAENWKEVWKVMKDSNTPRGYSPPNKDRGDQWHQKIEKIVFNLQYYRQSLKRIPTFSVEEAPPHVYSARFSECYDLRDLSELGENENGVRQTLVREFESGMEAITLIFEAALRSDYEFFETFAWYLKNASGRAFTDFEKLAHVADMIRKNVGRNPTRSEIKRFWGICHGKPPADWEKTFKRAKLGFLPKELGRKKKNPDNKK